MKLFKDQVKEKETGFEKTAAKYQLSNMQENWTNELLAQLYKQHAYMGKYDIALDLKERDPNGGYAHGVFVVSQKMAQPELTNTSSFGSAYFQNQAPSMQPSQATSVRVPIIIEAGKTYSFDVFIDKAGVFHPLNEKTIDEAIFNPSPFALGPAARPGMDATQQEAIVPDANYTRTAPPYNGMDKISSASIYASIPMSKRVEFIKTAEADSYVRSILENSENLQQSFIKILNTKEISKPLVSGSTTVVMKVPGGYKFKSASADDMIVEEKFCKNSEVPTNLFKHPIAKEGVCLLNYFSKPAVKDKVAAIEEITSDGMYDLCTADGKKAKALVFANLNSFPNKKKIAEVKLAISKDAAALKREMVGTKLASINFENAQLENEPRNCGSFIINNKAYEPVAIKTASKFSKKDGNVERSCTVEDSFGNSFVIKTASLIKEPIFIKNENTILIPKNSGFIELPEATLHLAEDAKNITKTASAKSIVSTVFLTADGNEFSFSGIPLKKVASVQKENLKLVDALLMLGLLGESHTSAMEKIAAAKQGNDKVPIVTSTKFFVQKPKQKKASIGFLNDVQLNLVKEAAAIANTAPVDTVDNVLSLGFINEETIAGFLDLIPTFEESLSKLAELLVAARLGLQVPESAILSSMSNLYKVVEGLKLLQISESAPEQTVV